MLVATDDARVFDVQVIVSGKDPSLVMRVPLADLGGAAWLRLISGKRLLNIDDGIADSRVTSHCAQQSFSNLNFEARLPKSQSLSLIVALQTVSARRSDFCLRYSGHGEL